MAIKHTNIVQESTNSGYITMLNSLVQKIDVKDSRLQLCRTIYLLAIALATLAATGYYTTLLLSKPCTLFKGYFASL